MTDVETSVEVLAYWRWASNAHLIEDVARLGYLDGRVIDLTFGQGSFWTRWQPNPLVANDLRPLNKRALKLRFGFQDLEIARQDFRRTSWPDRHFDAVVFDPPYKLNGTPSLSEFDKRYGIEVPTRWQDRYRLIEDGLQEAARLVRVGGFVLLKCADQVCSGAVRWQTIDFGRTAAFWGLDQVDRFDKIGIPRPQPPGRSQQHARRNGSTLLVFAKR